MRSPGLPYSYFLIVFLIFISAVAIDLVTSGTITLFSPLMDTLGIILIILVVYTMGVAILVRRIANDSSRFTATRIFMTILLGIGAFLALTVWINDATEIVLTLGIIIGAIFIALRDFIQNMVGSLMVLVTGIFRIGDRIRIRGVYGLVMDIGIFRTSLLQLDQQAGDHPTGEIVTIPNGIIFKENVTNTTRHLSIIRDEIQITLPYSADLENARDVLVGTIQKHTREIETRAAEEINNLSKGKFQHSFEVKPIVNMQLSDHGIIFILNFFTTSEDRLAIKTAIITDISSRLPGITEIADS